MRAIVRLIHLLLYRIKRVIAEESYILRMREKEVYISENYNVIERCSFEGKNTIGECNFLADISMGYGSYIGKECELKRTSIGRYCSIANRVSVALGGHPTKDFVSTHPAFFSESQSKMFGYADSQKYDEWRWTDKEKRIAVQIGNDVWIANDVVILEGITVGDGAIICAGAVVAKDVPPYAIVGGVPAKIIRYRFEKEEITFLLEQKWWNRDCEWIKRHVDWFENIKVFRENVVQEDNGSMKNFV